jgi:hypothetical protein
VTPITVVYLLSSLHLSVILTQPQEHESLRELGSQAIINISSSTTYPMPQVNLLPGAINEIIASVADSQSLTQTDRYGLMAAMLDESLSEDDHRSIDRLLRSVVRGRVQITA